jgi:UPF0716 protein FxsA
MPLLLLILFIGLPIAELYVIIQVGQWIGILPTLAILVLDGFLGAALARSQGRAAWARFNQALAEGRVPARETFDGAMIIVGGAFLLAPGFITDAIGLLLLLPPTRALLRGAIARMAKRRTTFAWTVAGGPRRGPASRGPAPGGYDYEGSAREVTDPPEQLDRPDPDG